MNQERLLRTAQVLEDLSKGNPPPGDTARFSLKHWWKCGTVGCAVGHAAQDPWHQEQGLELTDSIFQPGVYDPIYGGYANIEAVMAFYGVSLKDTRSLFLAYAYERGTAMAVARRIRRFGKDQADD